MTPRRIAYVVHNFPKLSETFIASEITELRRRGVEVIILARKHPSEPFSHRFIADDGLDRLVIYGEKNFSATIADFQPDLIHAHYSTRPTECARTLSAEFGIPFSFTAHGFDIYRRAPLDFAERAAAASALVTVSEANAGFIASQYGVPRQHIFVIPCGVDTAIFHPLVTAAADAMQLPLIVCVARHEPVKNLELLLEACGILRDRGMHFRCVMIGDGASHEELAATRTRLNLEAAVEMIGAAERGTVLAWLQRGSVAVLSSHNEGMPVCLMEAGACGVPVVATRVGGIPELIDDGVTGILTAAGDPAAFADALGHLLEEPLLRKSIGQAARRRIVARFSLDAQVDGLMSMWSRILASDT
jgi:colanic acid/amylovoran biosynthesis glycosyltransferase